MKKTFIALSMAVIASLTFSGYAQAQVENTGVQTEQTAKGEKRGTMKKGKNPNHNGKFEKVEGRVDGKRDGKRGFDPFRGIELTTEQKLNVQKAEEKMKNKMEDLNKKMREDREKVQSDFKKEMEKILTPEQLVKYNENTARPKAELKGNRPERKGAGKSEMRQGRPGKGDAARGDKGPRGEKKCKGEKQCTNAAENNAENAAK